MIKNEHDTYDVIIIGAGISGLVCGCCLAKAGMKVLIVEQHNKPGGYCTSFRRNGFIFDAAAHSFGSYREGGNFRKILTELGVDKIIEIKRFDPSDVIITPDFRITLWNDTKKTIANLVDIFPREERGLTNYYEYYNQPADSHFENIKLMSQTFASFLNSFFTDKSLINSLSFPVFGNGGLPPSQMHAFTGSRIYNEFLIDGGYYPEGGIQNLPNALEHIMKQNHGNILYRKSVRRILCKNNVAIGVKLDDDESYISKYVVSACDVTQTFKTLLKKDVVSKQLIDKLKRMTPSISTFILYVGIDKPFDDLPQPGTNIWYLSYYDLDKVFNYVSLCDFDNIGAFMMRVSPDRKTLLAFSLAPFKTKAFWGSNKKRIAQDFLDRVAKFIPNLKKHIVYFDAATPYTLYRYTLNYKGANYGWAPMQSQLFDPDFRQKSFLKNLYLTGHWTTQTHGIPGVAYLGYNAAKLILRKENLNIS